MIHKLGKDKNDLTSYSPISLLPIMRKIFEHVMLAYHRAKGYFPTCNLDFGRI